MLDLVSSARNPVNISVGFRQKQRWKNDRFAVSWNNICWRRSRQLFKKNMGASFATCSCKERSPMTGFKSLAQLYNFIKEKHQSENFVLKKEGRKTISETTRKYKIRIIVLYHQKGTGFVPFVMFSSRQFGLNGTVKITCCLVTDRKFKCPQANAGRKKSSFTCCTP